jgi:hypothetical protein
MCVLPPGSLMCSDVPDFYYQDGCEAGMLHQPCYVSGTGEVGTCHGAMTEFDCYDSECNLSQTMATTLYCLTGGSYPIGCVINYVEGTEGAGWEVDYEYCMPDQVCEIFEDDVIPRYPEEYSYAVPCLCPDGSMYWESEPGGCP